MVRPNKVIDGFNKNSITKIKATVGIWAGQPCIDIREYGDQEDFKGATRKGIHFAQERWEKFKDLVDRIDKEVRERTT